MFAVTGTQNNKVVGTDESVDDCIKNCRAKKLAKDAAKKKPHVHHVKSMHKGAPGHKTPHNKGPRNRKNMPPGGQPSPPGQEGQAGQGLFQDFCFPHEGAIDADELRRKTLKKYSSPRIRFIMTFWGHATRADFATVAKLTN